MQRVRPACSLCGKLCNCGILNAFVSLPTELDPGTGLPDLRELTKDDFQSCLDEAGSKLVIVDFFTGQTIPVQCNAAIRVRPCVMQS
jgi:hypothetical protein